MARFFGKKRSIFARIFFAAVIPLTFLFFVLIFGINLIIRNESENYARNTTLFFAEQLSIRIQDLFAVMTSALTITKEHLETVDYAGGEAAHSADTMVFSLIRSLPTVYNAWIVFEPGTVLPDSRFTRSYINGEHGIEEIFDMPDKVLDDPAQSPWYNIPLQTGNFYFSAVLPYDYGVGKGVEPTATMSFPLWYEGEVIGCVGADMAYDHTLSFMKNLKVLDEPVSIFLINRNKEVIYSNTGANPFSFGRQLLINDQDYNESVLGLTTVMHYARDPLSGTQYFISLSPLDVSKTSTQLFLYLELPASALKNLALRPLAIILAMSIAGFLVLVTSVVVTTRSFARPIRLLTEKAEQVATGRLDLEFATEPESTTELDTLNRALSKMLAQLAQMHSLKLAAITADFEREKIRASASAKSNFFASMSHEIRTPMNAISGLSELLLRMELGEVQRRHVRDIKISADALLKIVNDILDSAKMESGKLDLMPLDYDFVAMLDNLCSIITLMAEDKGLRFDVEYSGAIPACLYGDGQRLRQILLNLLSNAVKYTNEGFIRLRVINEGSSLLFCVMDSGIGIKEEAMSLIFDPYSQVGGSRHIEGTGLGLSITKRLVEMMEGELWVESRYGQGSSFYTRIPFRPGDSGVLEAQRKFASMKVRWNATVLVVDDNKINLNVAQGLLKQHGLTVDTALSGEEAIHMVRNKPYDMVFMDHMMPGMDGVETTMAIRHLGGRYVTLPIIALTANAMPGTREMLLEKGMDDFLSKPIELAMLRRVLEKWLDSCRQRVTQDYPGATFQPDIAAEKGLSLLLSRASQLGGLRIDRGLDQVCGQQQVYETSLRLLAENLEGMTEGLVQAWEMRDSEEMRGRVHALKGSFANVGAGDLSEQALVLEKAAIREDYSCWEESLPVFLERMTELRRGLEEVFRLQAKEEKPQGDEAFLHQVLPELIGALADYDYESSMELLGKVLAYTYDPETDAVLDSVRRSLQRFSYDDALLLLKDKDR